MLARPLACALLQWSWACVQVHSPRAFHHDSLPNFFRSISLPLSHLNSIFEQASELARFAARRRVTNERAEAGQTRSQATRIPIVVLGECRIQLPSASGLHLAGRLECCVCTKLVARRVEWKAGRETMLARSLALVREWNAHCALGRTRARRSCCSPSFLFGLAEIPQQLNDELEVGANFLIGLEDLQPDSSHSQFPGNSTWRHGHDAQGGGAPAQGAHNNMITSFQSSQVQCPCSCAHLNRDFRFFSQMATLLSLIFATRPFCIRASRSDSAQIGLPVTWLVMFASTTANLTIFCANKLLTSLLLRVANLAGVLASGLEPKFGLFPMLHIVVLLAPKHAAIPRLDCFFLDQLALS